MPLQDELFDLIKSLSPSEKRYFKVNASKGDSKSNYIKLFDAIEKQTEYDEENVKKKLAKEKFVKYLSAEKNHLHEQIMRSMRLFHANRTVDNKIHEMLQDEAFYRDKGLKSLREKTLLKAKELATKFERFHYLQEILLRQTGFVTEFEEKTLSQPVLNLLTERKQLANIQDIYLELWTKDQEMFSIYRSGADIKDPIIKNRAEMLNTEIERFRYQLGDWYTLNGNFNRAISNFHQTFGNSEAAFTHTLAEYELYQTKPHFKEEYAMKYKICLANVISRAYSARKFDDFLKYINELKSLPVSTFNEEGEVFQNVYFSEHLHYINSGAFEKAEALIPEIEEGLEKYADKINKARLLSFQFNIMVMYFIMHRFKEALKWSELLMEDKSEIKQGINVVTRILLPIIHFELGHADLVDSYTRSAYRDLQKKKRMHSFEKLMVSYLKSMPLSEDQEEFLVKLKDFETKLQALFDDSQEKVTYGMEEIKLWVTSKITGVKMSEQLTVSNS